MQAGFAQQTSSPPPPSQTSSPAAQAPKAIDAQDVVKITTNLVQIDAVVTDKNGKRIVDLRPDEIEIYEDGTKRTISNFSYINLNSTNTSPTPRATKSVDAEGAPLIPRKVRPDQVRRTIALVVDDLGLSFESAVNVRRSLRRFLDEQLQPDDLVAIIRTSGGIGALQSFTTDRRQLYASVDKVKWNLIGRSEISAVPFISDAMTLTRENPRQGTSTTEEMDVEKRLRLFRRDMFAVGTLGALHYVIKGLDALPGRKSVVLFSDGFKIPRDPLENDRILDILRELTDFANRASVVLYTIGRAWTSNTGINRRRFDYRLQFRTDCNKVVRAEDLFN